MQTFDRALYKLYKDGRISLEEALKNADSKNNLRLKITLDENPSARKEVDADGDGTLTDKEVEASQNSDIDTSNLALDDGKTSPFDVEDKFALVDLDKKP